MESTFSEMGWSLESQQTAESLETDTAFDTSVEQERLDVLARMLERLPLTGVSRDDAHVLYEIATEDFSESVPVNAFTLEPSRVNLDFALEGIASTIADGIKAVLHSIWKIIAFVFRTITAPARWLLGGGSSSSAGGGGGASSAVKAKAEALDKKAKKMNIDIEGERKKVVEMIYDGVDTLQKHDINLISLPGHSFIVNNLVDQYRGMHFNTAEIRRIVNTHAAERNPKLAYAITHHFKDLKQLSLTMEGEMLMDVLKPIGVDISNRDTKMLPAFESVPTDPNSDKWKEHENAINELTSVDPIDIYSGFKEDYLIDSVAAVRQDAYLSHLADDLPTDANKLTPDQITGLARKISDYRRKEGGHIKEMERAKALIKEKYEGDVMDVIEIALNVRSKEEKHLSDLLDDAMQRYDTWEATATDFQDFKDSNLIYDYSEGNAHKHIYRMMMYVDPKMAEKNLKAAGLEQPQDVKGKTPWWVDHTTSKSFISQTAAHFRKWLNSVRGKDQTPNLEIGSVDAALAKLDRWEKGLKDSVDTHRGYDVLSRQLISIYSYELLLIKSIADLLKSNYISWVKAKEQLHYSLLGMSAKRTTIGAFYIKSLDKFKIKVSDEEKIEIYNEIYNTPAGTVVIPSKLIKLLRDNDKLKEFYEEHKADLEKDLKAEVDAMRLILKLRKPTNTKNFDGNVEEFIRHVFVAFG